MASLSCPYCSRPGLRGQAGVNVHIGKSPACQAAQEKVLRSRAANLTYQSTKVAVLSSIQVAIQITLQLHLC